MPPSPLAVGFPIPEEDRFQKIVEHADHGSLACQGKERERKETTRRNANPPVPPPRTSRLERAAVVGKKRAATLAVGGSPGAMASENTLVHHAPVVSITLLVILTLMTVDQNA
ncbi:hypothetical protein CTI12_AA284340 [Artemisia annua]|uniref:Uncharacterized protein n=1 Tax=Artemisia annua TaxID=35608 RepID=A0A2U1NBC8_ARTAN|nr:hypothetical protein CTI12_AA284340 [Artemisia annua]